MNELDLQDRTGLIVIMNRLIEPKDYLLIDYVPTNVDLQSLEIRCEEGGTVFRDGAEYRDWNMCTSQLISMREAAIAFLAVGSDRKPKQLT